VCTIIITIITIGAIMSAHCGCKHTVAAGECVRVLTDLLLVAQFARKARWVAATTMKEVHEGCY